MKNHVHIPVAVACLALVTLACNALTNNGTPAIPDLPTEAPLVPTVIAELPLPTEEPQSSPGEVLFQDDFVPGRGEWGTGSDDSRTVAYVDESLNMKIVTENFFVWTTPNDKEYSNVHMEVNVFNKGPDPTTGFGLMCDMQFIEDSHYYFVITPAGDYAVALAALAQDDVFLTNHDAWGSSDLIPKNAASYRIGADCGKGTFTLYVNGQEIASVNDSTYTSGKIAIFAWSGKETNATDVSFDDFLMTQLP